MVEEELGSREFVCFWCLCLFGDGQCQSIVANIFLSDILG